MKCIIISNAPPCGTSNQFSLSVSVSYLCGGGQCKPTFAYNMTKFFIYLFIKPMAALPLPVLYLLSDFLYLLMRMGFAYRKKVVIANLKETFPEKSDAELRSIRFSFYRHFYDLISETIRTTGMGRSEALKRCRVTNPELLNQFFEENRSLIAVGGHYNNWELAAFVQPLYTQLYTLGIYSPLSNKTIDQFMVKSRGKFGMEMVPKRLAIRRMEAFMSRRPTITFFLSDQCPKNPYRAFWTSFLGRETSFPYGAGVYATKYNLPVIYGRVEKVSRGKYELTCIVLEENSARTGADDILEKFSRELEAQIIDKPEFWLWTHKRWKRAKPDDYEKVNKD